jgi:serine/threonine protein kinase
MLDLMKYHQYRQGFEESVCLCVLKQCLLGLEYLHKNSYIHRDVKSGNLLVERDGTVLLADFGVSSSLYDSEYYVTATTATTTEKKQLKRNTFVGTPCWIAPEVVQQIGYDQKADVWSFGITCLELTQGKAPFSK